MTKQQAVDAVLRAPRSDGFPIQPSLDLEEGSAVLCTYRESGAPWAI